MMTVIVLLVVVAGIIAVAVVWWLEDKYLPDHLKEGYVAPEVPEIATSKVVRPTLAITYIRPLLLEFHPRQAAVVLDFTRNNNAETYALDEAA